MRVNHTTLMFTYRAINTLNGKFYIGSTTNFESRKKQHLKDKRVRAPFQNALRKNPEAFIWEVEQDHLDEPILEQALLDMWFGCGQCYNLNPSAKHPPSHKGKVRSAEFKKNVSESLTGRVRSPEHSENISISKKGVNPFPEGIPDEVIAKRSASRVANGKKWTEEQRKIFGEKRRLPEEEVQKRLTLIKNSGINPRQRGFISKVASLLGVTHPGARGFLNRYYKSDDINDNQPQG